MVCLCSGCSGWSGTGFLCEACRNKNRDINPTRNSKVLDFPKSSREEILEELSEIDKSVLKLSALFPDSSQSFTGTISDRLKYLTRRIVDEIDFRRNIKHDYSDLMNSALRRLDNMDIDEFEQLCIDCGYTPKRK